MGLDMYLYRATRISSKEANNIKGMTINRISNEIPDMFVITESDMMKYPSLYAELKPYTVCVPVIDETIDTNKIMSDNSINGSLVGISFDDEKISFSFLPVNKTEAVRITLAGDDIERYTIRTEVNAYAVRIEEIAYWRKFYELQETFSEGRTVENCGFYEIKQVELKELNSKYKIGRYKNYDNDKNHAIFYKEWY